MNFKKTSFHLIAIALLLFLGSCSDKVKDTITYTANVPVYQKRAEFVKAVTTGTMQNLVKPGKIFLRGNYILINELYKGIHVIDNTSPASPKNVAFINIPGNVDLSARGNTLYADSYTDLVVMDITDPTKAVEKGRYTDAFPNVLPPTDGNYPVTTVDTTKGVVVGWTQEKVTVPLTAPIYNIYAMGLSSASASYFVTNDSWSSLASGITGQSALSGSMARFAIYNDMLYALTNTQMKIFSISAVQPVLLNSQWTAWQAETLFISGQYMYAGTRQGMVIYSLTDPSLPKQISSYSHIYSCDPVVVNGNYAYYTMLTGNSCGQATSGLGVVDISDPLNPVQISFFALKSPNGLGIDNKHLFVCNGDNGLLVYDVTNPNVIYNNLISSFTNIQAYDVIPYNNVLIVIGKGGLLQYDYSDITNIKLLSTITIAQGIM